MLTTKEEIENWLNKYNIDNYTINEDLTVDVQGNIFLCKKNLKTIPIKFNKIIGDLNCSYNNLTSLEFCPQKINGNFYCYYNQLSSLKFCPKKIKGNFNCSYNKLSSLEFCSEEINGYFDCADNKLSSLKFCPKKINGDFYCDNNRLISLEYSPQEINGSFYLNNNILEKKLLFLFNSQIHKNIWSDLGDKKIFLKLVQKQKILHEKEELNNNLHSTQNSQLVKKRL